MYMFYASVYFSFKRHSFMHYIYTFALFSGKEYYSEGEKEVQRTLFELLNQLDGFDEKKDIKVIMATNNIQYLDPALIRPGRIDVKIEIPLPSEEVSK